MSKEQPAQTLAVFILDNDDAAKSFLKVVQKIDEADKNVKIVDAAIADKTKRGRVKVHQTEDTGALKGGLRGGAIGVVVGTILLGPAGPLVGVPSGGVLGGLHNRFRDIGISDTFMKRTAGEVEKGKSALFVLYEGDWSGSIGAIEDAIKAHKALLIQSTLPPEAAAELKALVEPAAEELGGAEVVADFEVETEPEAAPAAAAPAIAEAEPDDLTKISGIGPKASEVLVAAGIVSYADLAGTSEPAAAPGLLRCAHRRAAEHRHLGDAGIVRGARRLGGPQGLRQDDPAGRTRQGRGSRQGRTRAGRPHEPRRHRSEGRQGPRGGRHHDLRRRSRRPASRRCARRSTTRT